MEELSTRAAIDMAQFHQVFFEEAAEHLANLENLLVTIDVATPAAEDLNAIFRAAHSIKGGSGTFGFHEMAEVTHELESLLDRVRKNDLVLRSDMIDVLLAAADLLRAQLAHYRGETPAPEVAVDAMCQRIRACMTRNAAPSVAAPVPAAAPAAIAAPARGRLRRAAGRALEPCGPACRARTPGGARRGGARAGIVPAPVGAGHDGGRRGDPRPLRLRRRSGGGGDRACRRAAGSGVRRRRVRLLRRRAGPAGSGRRQGLRLLCTAARAATGGRAERPGGRAGRRERRQRRRSGGARARCREAGRRRGVLDPRGRRQGRRDDQPRRRAGDHAGDARRRRPPASTRSPTSACSPGCRSSSATRATCRKR